MKCRIFPSWVSAERLYQFLICAMRGTRPRNYLGAVKKRVCLAIPRVEPRYFGFQGRSLDSMSTELPWLLIEPVLPLTLPHI